MMAEDQNRSGLNGVTEASEGEQPFECIPNTNLYVKNLEDDMDDEWLARTFEKFGTITSAKVMRLEDGSSKGFGFVCFQTPQEAAAAKDVLNGQMFGRKPLYINIAQKKAERQALLQEHWQALKSGNIPEGWASPVTNGRSSQLSTPPRSLASPQQSLTGKPVSLPAAPPAVGPMTQPQQVGGMNGFVFMGHQAVRQPMAAPVAVPRASSFMFAPASGVPHHPSVAVQYAWPTYGPSHIGANQGQPLIGMRPVHMAHGNLASANGLRPTHLHVAPGNPAPTNGILPTHIHVAPANAAGTNGILPTHVHVATGNASATNGLALPAHMHVAAANPTPTGLFFNQTAKFSHVQLGQNHMFQQFPFPFAVGQAANNVRNLRVQPAAVPVFSQGQTNSRSVWANGMR
ncbi:hypothetical protein ACOMHN_036869 [Nucella lapillus]